MAGQPDTFEGMMAQLAADPQLAGIAGEGDAWLVWHRSGTRLLWVSPAAAGLAGALALEGGGRIDETLPIARSVRALAGGLAPEANFRLERLPLDPARLAPPTTCACRRIVLPSGEDALITVIVGPVPNLRRRGRRDLGQDIAPPSSLADGSPGLSRADPSRRGSARAEPIREASAGDDANVSSHAPSLSGRESPEPQDPVGHLRRRGKTRFVWQADAEGRFTAISDVLREIVGEEHARIIGRAWDELLGSEVEDPSGRVSRAFSRGETWSGETIFWRSGVTASLVPVEFAGAPSFDRNGQLLGYRGFGLFRTGERAEPPDQDAGREEEGGGAPATTGPALSAEPPLAAKTEAGVEPDPSPEPEADDGLNGPEVSGDTEPTSRPFARLEGSAGDQFGDPPLPLGPVDDEAASAGPPAPPSEAPGRGAGLGGDGPRRPAAPIPRLSAAERNAFREIARALGARFDEEPGETAGWENAGQRVEARPPSTIAPIRRALPGEMSRPAILDHLPVGILVQRGEQTVFANRRLLDLTGYESLEQLASEGGLGHAFADPFASSALRDNPAPTAAVLSTRHGASMAVELRSTGLEWEGAPATLVVVNEAREAGAEGRLRATQSELQAKEARLQQLSAILDTATDGVVVFDDGGRIVSLNRSAEALFGYEEAEVVGDSFIVLLEPESHATARDYLDGFRGSGVASLLNDGREVLGRVRQGGTIPVFMTIGPVSEEPERKFCAVLRDITAFKTAESELMAAKRAIDEGSARHCTFLAKISHEIRTPLHAIIGFAEVMLDERFGPVGNERYKDYLRDIHASGGRVVKLVNDLVDLAGIEAGRMELAFTGVNLNKRAAECVAQMQAQAARQRIVIRTSFAPKLPPVVADERSIRQIMSNIVSNAIKFTDPGGQIIVSTALTDFGEVAIRVRDTGVGMSDEEVKAALAPFADLPGARQGGTGLGLPLTKALVEANRGALHITSARGDGTLVEVVFPPSRVLTD